MSEEYYIHPAFHSAADSIISKDTNKVYDEKIDKFGELGEAGDHRGIYSSNLIFDKNVDWYSRINRYGWINPFDNDKVLKEFLFFTKPDLNLFDANIVSPSGLVDGCYENSFLYQTASRMPNVLTQLTLSVPDPDGRYNPFMYLLSNSVSSKLDLP